MCSLIVARGLKGGPELFLIHNRDERLDRPSRPPQESRSGATRVVCPRDEKAGGTWLGLNEEGVVAAITNRFGARLAPGQKTRGDLPLKALEQGSAEEAARCIEALSAKDYPGFHLFIADTKKAFVVWNDEEQLHRVEVAPGLFVMTERSFEAAPSARLRFLKEKAASLAGWPDGGIQEFQEWMLHQDPVNPLESTCICSGPVYGTRCSTMIRLQEGRWSMEHVEGPPCGEEAKYVPVELFSI